MDIKTQKIFFRSNLKFLRERRKLSQDALSEKLNVTRAKLASLELGFTKAPQPEDYINVSNYFKVSIDTLMKVDMSKLGELKIRQLEAGDDVYIKGGNLRILPITVDKSNNENVEYVPIKAKMGYSSGGYADSEFIENLPKYSLPNLPKNGTYRTFPGEGASMLLPDGTDITGRFIQDWTTIKPQTACVVVLNGQQDFVFKQITLIKEEKSFLLKSLNPFFEPFRVAVEDVLEIWEFYCFTSKVLPEAETDLGAVIREIRDLKAMVGK